MNLLKNSLKMDLHYFLSQLLYMCQSTLNSCFFGFVADKIFSYPKAWQQNNFWFCCKKYFFCFYNFYLNSFLFIFWNCFFSKFPSSLKGVLYTSSIVPLIVFGATRSISAPPDCTTWSILCCAILFISPVAWLISFGATCHTCWENLLSDNERYPSFFWN